MVIKQLREEIWMDKIISDMVLIKLLTIFTETVVLDP